MEDKLAKIQADKIITQTTADAEASRRIALGALAIGAVAFGAAAIGALAIGALAIGRMRILEARIEKLSIGTLKVEKLELPRLSVKPAQEAGAPISHLRCGAQHASPRQHSPPHPVSRRPDTSHHPSQHQLPLKPDPLKQDVAEPGHPHESR